MKTPAKRIACCLLACASVLSVPAGILQPGDIVFAEAGLDLIIRLDPNTGVTNHIAHIDFSGASGGIALGRNGDIYVMRPVPGFGSYAEFIRIDGQTGATNGLSNETLIMNGSRMEVSPDGLSLVVAGETQSGATRGVFRVDLATGHQTVITTNLTDDPDYERPWDVAFSPQGHIYVTDWNGDNLLRFNADGTGRHVVTNDGLLDFPTGVDVAPDGAIYVASRIFHGIVRIDPVTGAQSSVTSFGFLSSPTDITVAPDGTLIVSESTADVIVRIDPATGQQTLLHSGTPGPRTPCVFSPLAPPPPTLQVHQSANGVVVRWTDALDAWQLQTNLTVANPGLWGDSNLVPGVNGDEREVTMLPELEALFFRLRQR